MKTTTLFHIPTSGYVYHSRVGCTPRHEYDIRAAVFLASANGRHGAGIYQINGDTYEQVASIYRPGKGVR